MALATANVSALIEMVGFTIALILDTSSMGRVERRA